MHAVDDRLKFAMYILLISQCPGGFGVSPILLIFLFAYLLDMGHRTYPCIEASEPHSIN